MPTGLLEFSGDPLSDASPTYVDVTSYLVGPVPWSDGKTRDLDEPQAGSMSFRLRNRNREWEPEYSGAVFDAKPLRRFRWSVDGTAEGIWYATSWRVTWPAGTSYSEVEVSCVDGFELLSLDLLDLLDPPTASSYEEVVMADQPFAYYRMNDVEGTQLKATTGDDMRIVGGPLPVRDGLIVGDTDLARALVRVSTGEQYARAAITAGQFGDTNKVTAGGWFRNLSPGTDWTLLRGPEVASTDEAFRLAKTSGNVYRWVVVTAAGASIAINGTTTATTTGADCVFGTWDGQTATLYVNGVAEAQAKAPLTIGTGTAELFLHIGTYGNFTGSLFIADEVEFHETCLTAERIMARFLAGSARGFNEQTAGERVAAVADSPLWAETELQTGEHMVHPVMEHGQSKLDEIRAAVKAEMPDSLFYFNGDGDPTYLAWNYKDGLGPLATFGAGPSEIRYQALEPVYDDEIFNEVTVGHEAAPGEETQHTVTDQDSIDAYYRRAHAETGLILADHHAAIAVATAILDRHRQPMQRFVNITINSANTAALTQILDRQIGDMIRIKGLSASGTPIDVVTTILGRSKTLDTNGHMVCTWNTARGFNAAAGVWQLGIDGWSELNQTAVLA